MILCSTLTKNYLKCHADALSLIIERRTTAITYNLANMSNGHSKYRKIQSNIVFYNLVYTSHVIEKVSAEMIWKYNSSTSSYLGLLLRQFECPATQMIHEHMMSPDSIY